MTTPLVHGPDPDTVTAEPTTLFAPGQPPVTVPYEQLAGETVVEPQRVDRGSRAETIAYGGGLRATPRRIAAASALALALAAAVGVIAYMVNGEASGSYPAAVAPAGISPLDFPATRPLASILVSPGQRVRPGQLLATQSDPVAAAEAGATEAAIADDGQRLADLRSALAATPPPAAGHPAAGRPLILAQIAETEASLALAREQLAVARADLSTAALRAPAAGVVLRTAGTPGELVGPGGVRDASALGLSLTPQSGFHLFPSSSGASTNLADLTQPVVALVQGRRWQVVAEIPEAAITGVTHGEQATFRFDTFGGRSVPATVSQVVGSPIQVDGQVDYQVVLSLRAPLPSGVLPGMTGTVSLGG